MARVRPIVAGQALGWLSLAVLCCVSGLAAAMFFVTHSVVRDQEQRLLHERAKEVGLTVTSELGSLASSLEIVENVSRLSGYSPAGFRSAAAPLLSGGGQAIGIVQARGAVIRTLAGTGSVPRSDQALPGQEAALLRRAMGSPGLVSTIVSGQGRARLAVALRGPNRTAIYEQSAVDPQRPIPAPAGSPYSELTLMLYAAPRADPSQLLLTTSTQRKPTGMVDRQLLRVGSERWLLVTGSRRPLVGSFTAQMPALVLAAILFAALLSTAFVELLGRRRRYALSLVKQRTAELQDALERQVLLEQEHRQAKDSAERANRAKSEFLSRMSHELRTPLNAILGFGQLLELDELDERQRQNVAYILKGGRHLLELINEVLDLARIESGQLRLSPEPVPLRETIDDALALVQPLAGAQQITVTADAAGVADDAHVQADRQRLKQVVLNLLSNAIKYNRAEGRVDVSLASLGTGRTRITVSDTGIGIAREHIAHLFEPFERLGAEHSEVEGTGLGLALSKRLIEAMGGSIAVDSEPGRGTTVTVELETVPAPGSGGLGGQTIGPSQGAESDPSDDQRRVLYVEDNLSNLTLVERILEREPGIELVPSMQGRLGLELARQHRPALIMLDLHLPDMSGEEVLRRLKADPVTREIPVIVLSADASHRRIERVRQLGAADYLTKPLDVQRFLEVVAANALEPERA